MCVTCSGLCPCAHTRNVTQMLMYRYKERVSNRHGTPHTEHAYNTVAIAKIGSSKSAFHVGSRDCFTVSVLYVTAPAAEIG